MALRPIKEIATLEQSVLQLHPSLVVWTFQISLLLILWTSSYLLFHHYCSALSTLKPVLKSSYGDVQVLSSSGRSPKSGKVKFVNFDSNVKESTGSLLPKEHTEKKKDADINQVSHDVREYPTDKSQNGTFTIIDMKYDCSKVTSIFLGLTFEGTKGSYKRMTECIGTSKDMLDVDDVLLSIDNNDVQQMSLCGMRKFLMRLVSEKNLYCQNAMSNEGKITFKRRFLRLKFKRRISADDAAPETVPLAHKLHETCDSSTQNVAAPPAVPTDKKRKQHLLPESDSENDQSAEMVAKRKCTKRIAKPKAHVEELEEAEFDEVESHHEDDIETAEELEKKVALMNRIKPKCRIFWNEHPAEVIAVNRKELTLQVRWSSNKVDWICIERDRIQLQEDLVMSSRSTRC